jgi:hypothetical protein
MTTHLGNSGKVRVDATHYVGELVSWSVEETVTTVDDSAIDDASDTHLVGSKAWTGQATCMYDPGDTNGQVPLAIGTTIDLALLPIGAATGSPILSGTATVTKVSVSGARNQRIEASFEFKGNGDLTHDVTS